MNRKDFFETACPALVLGYFSAASQSCSKEKETTTPPVVVETEISKIKMLFNSLIVDLQKELFKFDEFTPTPNTILCTVLYDMT